MVSVIGGVMGTVVVSDVDVEYTGRIGCMYGITGRVTLSLSVLLCMLWFRCCRGCCLGCRDRCCYCVCRRMRAADVNVGCNVVAVANDGVVALFYDGVGVGDGHCAWYVVVTFVCCDDGVLLVCLVCVLLLLFLLLVLLSVMLVVLLLMVRVMVVVLVLVFVL